MLNTKRIQRIITGLALLISLVSFSGFSSMSASAEKPRTELIVSEIERNNLNVKPYLSSAKAYQNILLNQYTVFSFKCLLNIHNFDFTVTLKSQKEAVLQFLEYHYLEQNLIAQMRTNNYQDIFIK